MKLKEKFDSIDQSKLNSDQKAFLSKIEKATKNFTSDNKEVNDKVESALDKMIATFKEKMPEVIKTKEVKTETKKEGKKEPKKSSEKQSKTDSPKRTVMSVAKEIRKDGESWADAQKRATDIIKKEKKEASKEVTSEMEKLFAFIKTRKELDGISGTDLGRDSVRTAKRRGSRVVTNEGETSNQYGTFPNKLGRKYWESRDNHADRLAPKYPENAPLLESGGDVGGYDLAGQLGGHFNVGQNDGDLDGFTGVYYDGLVGETGTMSAGELFEAGGYLTDPTFGSFQSTVYKDGGKVPEVFVNKDGIRVIKMVEPKKKISEKEWMAKHNDSKEARAYAKGGNLDDYGQFIKDEFPRAKRDANKFSRKTGLPYIVIVEKGNEDRIAVTTLRSFMGFPESYREAHDILYQTKNTYADGGEINAFSMRMVKGTGKNPDEVLTDEKQVKFEKGGSFRKKREDYLSNLGALEADVWDEIGGRSGGEIRANEKLLKEYAEKVEAMLEKQGVGKGSFDNSDYQYYENWNWHLFNDFLVWNRYYEPEMTEKEKKWRLESFKKGNSASVANPEIINVSSNFDKNEKYISHRNIKSVTVNVKGKKLTFDADDVLNGANFLEKGNILESKAFYVPKRDVVSVELKDGKEVKPSNGYWIKKSYANGGKVTFEEKSNAIAKNFKGKRVEPKYQKEYGKIYDAKEAKEVGNKIAGAQKAKYDAKAEKGMNVGNKRGNGSIMLKAKEIRKDGESWKDALKRAGEMLKK